MSDIFSPDLFNYYIEAILTGRGVIPVYFTSGHKLNNISYAYITVLIKAHKSNYTTSSYEMENEIAKKRLIINCTNTE